MITLFKEITTEDALIEIEKESEKWTDLYCDMDNKEERKFVKDKSAFIESLRKKVNASRIKQAKDYRNEIEAEAGIIDQRLVAANKPFMSLISEHKEKRAKILAAEKAEVEARELAIEILRCHEEAFLIDKVMMIEIQERIEQQKQRDNKIAEDAANRAIEVERSRVSYDKADKEARRLRAESDKQLRAKIHGQIKQNIMTDCGVDEETAIKVVKSMIKQERVTIHYL